MHTNIKVIKVADFKSELKFNLWGYLDAAKASEANWCEIIGSLLI